MSALKIMAAVLDDELQNRGIFSIRRAECETIVARMIERTQATLSSAPLATETLAGPLTVARQRIAELAAMVNAIDKAHGGNGRKVRVEDYLEGTE